jgi:hypothetical protein
VKPTLWRPGVRIVALAVVVALSPLPVFAGGGDQATKAPGLRASAAAVVKTERLAARPAAAQATTVASDTGSAGFFKKPVGIAVLATLAAGVGYAIYSTRHDRITSPAKK